MKIKHDKNFIKNGTAGRKLLRPTQGKVKEALFDIIRERISDSVFLDLYAGTGAVGIEALLQGASDTIFVEASKRNSQKIIRRIEKFGFSDRADIVAKKVLSFIEWAQLNGLTFDIIFLDPPYNTDEITHVLSAIDGADILKEKGTVIAEHFKKTRLPAVLNRLRMVKDYKYGDTVLSFYEAF
jgi:16S rRNA (guanine(966)-N(2))-methyltransferase RsmD